MYSARPLLLLYSARPLLIHYLSSPSSHTFYAALLDSVNTSETNSSLVNEVKNYDNSSGTKDFFYIDIRIVHFFL